MAAKPPTGMTMIKGEEVDFGKLWGTGNTVFVLEFWATWCPPCRTSIPHLSKVQEKYKDKNVIFIGITNEDAKAVKPFVEQMGAKMDYRVALDSAGTASANYMSAYGIRGIPHAFVIGKDGKVGYHGHPMDPSFETEIQKAANVASKPSFDPSKLTAEELAEVPVKDLKEFLGSKGIDYSAALEKKDLIELIKSKF